MSSTTCTTTVRYLQGPDSLLMQHDGLSAALLAQRPQLDGSIRAARDHLSSITVDDQSLDVVRVAWDG